MHTILYFFMNAFSLDCKADPPHQVHRHRLDDHFSFRSKKNKTPDWVHGKCDGDFWTCYYYSRSKHPITIKLLRSQLANLIESFLIALSQPTTPHQRAQPPFTQWQGNAKVDSSGKVTRLPEFLITMPDWQLLQVRRALVFMVNGLLFMPRG